MKTDIKTFFTVNHPVKNDWSFDLLPSIWLAYEKDNYFHGKQFVIEIAFLFWIFDIEFNEH